MANNEPKVERKRFKKKKKVERKGFWDEVDLRFGAIDMTNVNRKERGKKETIRKAPKKFQI